MAETGSLDETVCFRFSRRTENSVVSHNTKMENDRGRDLTLTSDLYTHAQVGGYIVNELTHELLKLTCMRLCIFHLLTANL